MSRARDTAGIIQYNHLTIDDANDRVGIGSSVPTTTLDVAGNTTIASNGRLNVYRPTATSGNTAFQINSNVGGTDVTQFIILAGGSTGIGTDSPGGGSLLHVHGGAASTKNHLRLSADRGLIARLGDTSSGAQSLFDMYDTDGSTQIVKFVSGGGDNFVNTGGNLGIGTDGPGANLHVQGATGGAGQIYLTDGDAGGVGNSFLISKGGTTTTLKDRQASSNLDFGSADTFAMRIDSSQRLLIGSTQNANNDQLQVNNSGGSNLGLSRFSANAGGPDLFLIKSRDTTVGDHTTVADNDVLGQIRFRGDDGSNYIEGCRIFAEVNGSVSTGSIPTDIVFGTGTTGTERLRIQSDGKIVTSGGAAVGTVTLAGDGKDLVFGRTQNSGTGGVGRLVATGSVVYFQAAENTSSGSAADLVFGAYGGTGEKLRITSGGNVSIQNDSGKFTAGTGNDLSLYHDGTDSFVDNSTGDLILRSTGDDVIIRAADDVIIQSQSSENAIICNNNGNVALYHNAVEVFQTTDSGILIKANEGAGTNLEMYADQGDDNADKFRLQVGDGGPFKLQNYASGAWETSIEANGDGNVELYHNNNKKLETTSSGVDVTGTVTMDTVAGTNTNADLSVLFQTSAGVIDGGSGLTYNPGGDSLSVNGAHISVNTFRGAGGTATLTNANNSGSVHVQVTDAIELKGFVTATAGAAAEIDTLSDGATVTPNLDASVNFTITLGGNRTLANPSAMTAGQSGSIFVVQDGTGGRSFNSFGSYWDFIGGTLPTFTSTASAVDRIDYIVRSSTKIHAVFTANYS